MQTMEEEEMLFTLVYVLVAICFVHPPTEFVSAGLTVQALLGGVLGSEQLNFIQYHMKRTAYTAIVHSLIPLGYFLGFCFFSETTSLFEPWELDLKWKMFVLVSVMIPVCVGILVFYWSRNKWKNHHIAKALQRHAPDGSSWNAVASSINIEFRRFDKFTTGIVGRRLIVTDSWVIRTSTYHLYVAHQNDIHLTLVNTEEHQISYDSPVGVQYLNITVSSVREHVKPFTIRLKATEYTDLKDKLQVQIRTARDVVIRQTLSDRFLQVFREQVEKNPIYYKPRDEDIESCIGCMQKLSNIKLVKRCESEGEGECQQCYCRPMWCLECMGKWYASRQDQNEPETWMANHSPCPTCRARFCMLDVCLVQ